MTAATVQVATFLCPSDPNPGSSGTMGWTGAQKLVGANNYPANMGTDRAMNSGWRQNGAFYVMSSWDGAFMQPTRLATFVDGTSNTAIFSEWVKGPAVGVPGAPDGLGMVYTAPFNVGFPVTEGQQATQAQIYQNFQSCQNLGKTQNWSWKGEWWIEGDRQSYTHTMLPNRRACFYGPNDDGTDRGAVPGVGASSLHPGGVNVGFGDGSVKFVKSTVNFIPWYAIATPNGGETVSSDQLF